MEIVEKIIAIVNECMNNNGELTIEQLDDDLVSLGMDSIKFINIVVTLEEVFNIDIPDENLLMSVMNTIGKMNIVITSIYNSKLNTI